jgi:hypothetical protein
MAAQSVHLPPIKDILGVNSLGVLCFGRWILRVIALYRLNTTFSAAAMRPRAFQLRIITKAKSRPIMLSQMLGKYNIDMITSNIVNMGNHTDDKGPTEYARYELPGF